MSTLLDLRSSERSASTRRACGPAPAWSSAIRRRVESQPTLQVKRAQPVTLKPYAWQVLVATFLVAVVPLLIVWWLRDAGAISSTVVGMVLATVLSLAFSYAGRVLWEMRAGAGDLLFGELMVWGFVRRWRNERRLACALTLLGSMNRAQRGVAGGLSAEAQAKALEELSRALEARDANTHGHSRRVARHAWMIAKRMGLSAEEVARIRTAAAVHDVGKLNTPPAVLRKPGRLSDEEFAVIKLHPVDGAQLTTALGDARLTSIVRHHHERLDGTGYPDRLRGDEIPLGARIIAVADTFDAITSVRPYRDPRSHHQAVGVLKKEAGTQLDPAVVRAFCALYSGRRSLLALWASVTSLPGQAFSSFGGSVAGAATAVKVVTVAAVVGTAAAGTSSIAQPPAHHHSAPVSLAAASAAQAEPLAPAGEAPVQLSPGARGASSPAGRAARARVAVAAAAAVASASPVAAGLVVSLAGAPAAAAFEAAPPAGPSGAGGGGAGRGESSSPSGAAPVAGATGSEAPAKGAGGAGKRKGSTGKSAAPSKKAAGGKAGASGKGAGTSAPAAPKGSARAGKPTGSKTGSAGSKTPSPGKGTSGASGGGKNGAPKQEAGTGKATGTNEEAPAGKSAPGVKGTAPAKGSKKSAPSSGSGGGTTTTTPGSSGTSATTSLAGEVTISTPALVTASATTAAS